MIDAYQEKAAAGFCRQCHRPLTESEADVLNICDDCIDFNEAENK